MDGIGCSETGVARGEFVLVYLCVFDVDERFDVAPRFLSLVFVVPLSYGCIEKARVVEGFECSIHTQDEVGFDMEAL